MLRVEQLGPQSWISLLTIITSPSAMLCFDYWTGRGTMISATLSPGQTLVGCCGKWTGSKVPCTPQCVYNMFSM